MAGFDIREARGEMDIQKLLKKLPSVENVLQDNRIEPSITRFSRKGITRIVREVIASHRERITEGRPGGEGDLRESVVEESAARIGTLAGDRMRRVINATGVVLHTNFGRALLGEETCGAIMLAASGYTDLEIDLATGDRVDRSRRVRRLLSLITGSEDALVVNNNASAVLLAVQTFARSGGVAISRGEMVEIGGSFRLPEILASAAGRVIEVGTTNRTHEKDYERAIEAGANLLLKVHTSNYRIVGYTNEVTLTKLVEVGRRGGVPVMYDQGSGVLFPMSERGIEGEECIEELVDTGVDLISFSADKVLGAPQGGIILGRRELIDRMNRNHLFRALRVDKLTLAGLESVLLQYWTGNLDGVRSLGMIILDPREIRSRAERFAERIGDLLPAHVTVGTAEGESSIGGGSFPINPLRTTLVEINLPAGLSQRLSDYLRRADPALFVRVKGESILLDLRTVVESDEPILLESILGGIGNIRGRE
jgi:L-seryl-tRNA(Ser) seleniumtransferase